MLYGWQLSTDNFYFSFLPSRHSYQVQKQTGDYCSKSDLFGFIGYVHLLYEYFSLDVKV